MPNGIQVDIIGKEEIFNLLAKLPTVVQDTAVEDANEYLLNVVRTYPSYRHITRAQAYPEVGGWFSEKQRRYVMGAISRGEIKIPYPRTQGFRRAWRKQGSGQNQILVNDSPAGPYIMGEERQSRMSALIGWKKPSQIMTERQTQLMKVLDGSIKKALRKFGAD